MTYRILQLISGPGLYGAERMVLELGAFLQQQGVDVHLACLESDAAGPLGEAARQMGLAYTTLPGELRRPDRLVRALAGMVERLGIQLVHSHSIKADAMQRLATFPRGVRRVATRRGRTPTSAKLRGLELINGPALRLMDHVVALSPLSLEQLRGAGLDINRSTLIENGLDLPAPAPDFSAADLRASLGVGPDQTLLVRACRLVPAKGIDLLLRAMARQVSRHDLRLVLAGEGPAKDDLRQLAARLDLGDRVTFAGHRDDVPDLLRAADLMVLSSREEGLPSSMLQAMALGVPLVAANVGGGIRRLIQPASTGWLVRGGDLDELSLAVTEALDSPELGEKYAAAALAVYQHNHTRAAMGEQYLALYQALLG